MSDWTREALTKVWETYLDMDGRDPLRPWWTEVAGPWQDGCDGVVGWRRDDGRQVDGVQPYLARIDREHPLPPPEPALGQRWFVASMAGLLYVQHHEIVGVTTKDGLVYLVSWSHDMGRCMPRGLRHTAWDEDGENVAAHRDLGQWPPSGAVCIDQRGRPWAPVEVLEGLLDE